jgi:hypothetical protein
MYLQVWKTQNGIPCQWVEYGYILNRTAKPKMEIPVKLAISGCPDVVGMKSPPKNGHLRIRLE